MHRPPAGDVSVVVAEPNASKNYSTSSITCRALIREDMNSSGELDSRLNHELRASRLEAGYGDSGRDDIGITLLPCCELLNSQCRSRSTLAMTGATSRSTYSMELQTTFR